MFKSLDCETRKTAVSCTLFKLTNNIELKMALILVLGFLFFFFLFMNENNRTSINNLLLDVNSNRVF